MIGPNQLATKIKQHLNESLNNIVSGVVIFGSRVKGAGNIKSRITRMINKLVADILNGYMIGEPDKTDAIRYQIKTEWYSMILVMYHLPESNYFSVWKTT